MSVPDSAAKILIIDDQQAIRLTLQATLSKEGHQVILAENGQQALDTIATQTFDVALIDLNLGDEINGTDVLAALRRQAPHTVAIILTAQATLDSAVEALRQGAHDYLFKPCSTVELRESIRQGLLKRQQKLQQQDLIKQLGEYLTDNLEDIQAVLSQQQTTSPASKLPLSLAEDPPEEQEGRFLQQDDLIVDFLRHVITLDGILLELSPTEFDLLAYMISEAPRVIAPQELLREVQGYESEPWEASETIRAHIYHIRKKIKNQTGHADIIRTVRGVGYTIG